ncbi:MAG: hypothetical protein Q9226_008513, partial [Calogaya cf. arnoldii]
LRNNRSSNRSGRSQVDHDVFEGLPVRHWRKAPIAVSTAPPKEEPTANSTRDTLFVELAMPRDSQLLSPMSQALLRAARSGEMTKKAAPQPLQEDEKENADDDEPAPDVDLAFLAKRWAAVPRHLEGPEPEFLAKRRKGLPSAYTGSVGQANGAIPMRKTKVRKFDASGNPLVLDVLVPDGQTVDGEVLKDETDVTQAPAAGTVVEGVGVANAEGVIVAGDQMLPTPPRRRPPPPKRKAKGPGRGRKKKVAFVPGTDGLNRGDSLLSPNNGANGLNRPSTGQSEDMTTDGDAVMGDDLALQNGEESSEEDDEVDEVEGEGEDGDREDGELSPSPKSPQSPTKNVPLDEPHSPTHVEQLPEITTQLAEPREASPASPTAAAQRDPSSWPDMSLSADREMAELSNLSNSLDVRILGPQPTARPVTVEETFPTTEQSATDTPVMADFPPNHNPLDGLAAPEPPAIYITPEPETQISDGEDDLLGSLEKQLNRNDAAMSTTM